MSARAVMFALSAFAATAGAGAPGSPSHFIFDASSVGTAACAQIEPGETLSIEQAIDIALCNHPRIRQSWAEVMDREAELGVAQAAYYPTFSLSNDMQAQHNKTEAKDLPAYSSDVKAQELEANLTGIIVLYDFGKRAAARRRAAYMIRVAERNRGVTVLQVCLDTAAAYFEGLEAQAGVTAARNAEVRATTSLDIARQRQAAGAGTIAEVLTSEAALARAQLRESRAALESQLALGRLAVAMGLPPGRFIPLASDSNVSVRELPFANVEELLELADADSPAIQSAREAYVAAQMAVQVARTQNRPSFTLGANANVSVNKLKDRDNDFGPRDIPTDSVRNGNVLRMSVSIPLFSGFRASHQVRQARAKEEHARWAVEDTRLRAGQTINEAFETAASELKNMKLSSNLVELTVRALDAAVERYRTGIGSLSDVIMAQNAVDDAESDRIGATARLREARLNLALAIGRIDSWAFE